MATILLSGGVVLTHDADDHVVPLRADLLIQGKKIVKIGKDITLPGGSEVIDCTDKLICPGFVDTHRHLWQSILKGRHANEMLLDYFGTGNFQSSLHSPGDLFWGQLSGALESIDAGTTTIVDHSHINYSMNHSRAAIAGSTASGIRSVFCYCPTPRLTSWDPFELDQNILEDWVVAGLETLAAEAPFGNGRVQLGLAFDGIWLGKDVVGEFLTKAKALGIRLITAHAVHGHIQKYKDFGLLDSTILFSHASGCTAEEADLLKIANAHISTTPSTELQMAMGEPLAFHSKLDFQSHASLGVDCHSNNSASIIGEARLLLQAARGMHGSPLVNEGKVPKKVFKTVEEAFNLATVGGARAANMSDRIGSLEEGKLADIVIFDAISPSMLAAAQQDPIAAIILHSSSADIEYVIIDGVVRKKHSKLVDVRLDETETKWSEGKTEVRWKDVVNQILQRREIINDKNKGRDWEKIKHGAAKAFGLEV